MRAFLRFTIYAPLGSWGEIAVGEHRGTWDRPSRSAILGLLGAALGLLRSDEDGHRALHAGYGLAVCVVRPGREIVDYHSAQAAPRSVVRARPGATRRELLRAGDVATMLSRRSYLEDGCWTVVLWAHELARWALGDLQRALAEPAFVLYAGRKANPLGLPLAPTIVHAATLAEALRALPVLPAPLAAQWGSAATLEVSHDPCGGLAEGLGPIIRQEVRRDDAPDRTRWQFAERIVETRSLTLEVGGA